MKTKSLQRLRLATGLLAVVALLASTSVLGSIWYTVSVDTLTLQISGDKAWPGFSSVVIFAATAGLLGLYFRRRLAIAVIAANALVTSWFVFTAFIAFSKDEPQALELEVAKATGIASDFSDVTRNDLKYIFLVLLIVALVLILTNLIMRSLQKTERMPKDRFERNTQSTDAADPISLWDSQS